MAFECRLLGVVRLSIFGRFVFLESAISIRFVWDFSEIWICGLYIEIAKLEKGFPWLATTAAGAPMLGFLGTVTGMVRAFYNMASAGNNADISTLSGGIYEALVTTVAGLIVGIIALFAYNYLVSRVDGVMNQLEAKTMEFMDLLNEPAE